MRQRANIVRTLVYDPEVILMDEPFGPLDAQTRLILQDQLLGLWDATRKTIVFITHDLTEADDERFRLTYDALWDDLAEEVRQAADMSPRA
jgi:ABC-type proline/glycine betaine transport system ATPase subunit